MFSHMSYTNDSAFYHKFLPFKDFLRDLINLEYMPRVFLSIASIPSTHN
jgi:hypothetical protein